MPMFEKVKAIVNEICNWHSENSELGHMGTEELLILVREDITEVDNEDVSGSLLEWYQEGGEPGAQHLGAKVRNSDA